MFDKEALAKIKEARNQWLKEAEKTADQNKKFITISSAPVEFMGTPDMLENFDYFRDLNYPGEFPYTRGCMPPCIADGPGLCASFPGWVRRNRPISVITIYSNRAATDSRWPLICPP